MMLPDAAFKPTRHLAKLSASQVLAAHFEFSPKVY
jgi:hypothetical protein